MTVPEKPSKVARAKKRPARNPAEVENKMVSLAMELAERQLEEGTVSSQVLVHFLKAGSERDRLERAKLEAEMKLLERRAEAIESAEQRAELYDKAIRAMQRYSGSDEE